MVFGLPCTVFPEDGGGIRSADCQVRRSHSSGQSRAYRNGNRNRNRTGTGTGTSQSASRTGTGTSHTAQRPI